MYNPQIETFVTVAECGSFSKAADKLYLSSTAIMKQINTLETHLGLTLIERGRGGIKLTSVGKKIYDNAKFIINYSNEAIADARKSASSCDKTYCIGTSLLNPAKPFMDLWYKVSGQFPGYNIHIVPFEDNHENITNEIEQLGKKYTFIIGICDSESWFKICNFKQLGNYKKMVAVSPNHHLATKKSLKISDLYGETLMMVKEGDSSTNDAIRHFLQENHPQIKIEDTATHYDMAVFNRCSRTNNVLLITECWQDVHPALVSIPVEWDFKIPYGLLYAKKESAKVNKFLKAIEGM